MTSDGCCRTCSDYTGVGCCIREDDFKKKAIAEVTQNRDRHCTDVPCLLILIVVFISQIYLISYASDNGADPDALLHGYDYNGDWCTNNFNAWVDPGVSSTLRICIDSCDDTTYESEEFLDAYCIPTDTSTYEAFSDFTDYEASLQRGISDIDTASYMILISAFIAILFSFIYLKLIEYVGGFIIWCTIIALYLGGAIGAYLLIEDGVENYNNDTTSDTARWELALGILIIIILLIGFCLLFWLKKRIDLALQILDEAGDAISDIKTTLLFPIIYCIPVMLYLFFWIAVALYIFSAKESHTEDLPDAHSSLTDSGTYTYYDFDEGLQGALIYHFITLFYMMQVIIYFGFMVLAGTIADWYFSEWNNNQSGKVRGTRTAEFSTSPILESLWRVFRYHLGSLAFGALIITIIRIIRTTLYYLQKKIEAATGGNPIVKCIGCCVQCCLACCQCIIDKCSKDGFIFCSIYGTNFCYSSYNSIKLIWKNIGRTTMVEGISKYMEIIGRFGIASLTTGICVIIFKEYTYYQNHLSSYLYPMIIIFIISYLISSLFMMVFEVAVDTIFLCFLIDEEVHGSPKFASRGLAQLAAKHGPQMNGEAGLSNSTSSKNQRNIVRDDDDDNDNNEVARLGAQV